MLASVSACLDAMCAETALSHHRQVDNGKGAATLQPLLPFSPDSLLYQLVWAEWHRTSHMVFSDAESSVVRSAGTAAVAYNNSDQSGRAGAWNELQASPTAAQRSGGFDPESGDASSAGYTMAVMPDRSQTATGSSRLRDSGAGGMQGSTSSNTAGSAADPENAETDGLASEEQRRLL
jgi:hypothetical protein